MIELQYSDELRTFINMKIQILMSTYNGAQYIRTQLDSIVQQTVKNKSLLIRDDGSTDNTVDIILEYKKKYPWIEIYKGENLGVQKSFFKLIENSDSKVDYIAFADQDDEWLPEKLERATQVLEKLYGKETTCPLLYCGKQIIVDEQLHEIDVSVSRIVRKVSFGNALVQNICTGCTAVINQKMASLMRKNIPVNIDAIIMHDWWLYLIASCFGKVYYDDVAYIRYRQHGKNAHGVILNKWELFLYRVKQLRKPRGEIYRQVEEFRTAYAVLIEDSEMNLIRHLLGSQKYLIDRFRVATNKTFFRQKKSDDIVFRGIVLLGKL